MLIEMLVSYCVRHDLISDNETPLLKYCIEKKLSTFFTFVPLIVVGSLISDFFTTISFLGAFSYLRRTTNGFHAKTAGRCFVSSFLVEMLVLECVKCEFPVFPLLLATAASVLMIWILSPYDHPNMNYSTAEIIACRASSRIRLIITVSIMFLFYAISEVRIARSINFGLILAAGLLGFAYIIEWRNLYGYSQRQEHEQALSDLNNQNDSKGDSGVAP